MLSISRFVILIRHLSSETSVMMSLMTLCMDWNSIGGTPTCRMFCVWRHLHKLDDVILGHRNKPRRVSLPPPSNPLPHSVQFATVWCFRKLNLHWGVPTLRRNTKATVQIHRNDRAGHLIVCRRECSVVCVHPATQQSMKLFSVNGSIDNRWSKSRCNWRSVCPSRRRSPCGPYDYSVNVVRSDSCNIHRMLLGWLNQGGWGGRDM
jgi:hypothetical protein